MLKLNPIDVMNDVQRFLKISPIVDYTNLLRYDVKKGFFCQLVDGNHTKCLGKSKGKQYAAMEEKSFRLLQRYVVHISLWSSLKYCLLFFTDII